MKTFKNESGIIRTFATLLFGLFLAALTACGGGGAASTGTAAPNTLPTGSLTGAWNITLSGQTLPCAVQAIGGTINGVANGSSYHSIAIAYGTINITPLTEIMVANLSASATPSVWFKSLASTPSKIASISLTSINLALAKFKAAMPALSLLNTINPITTTFTPTSGDVYDDALTALQTAITNLQTAT